MKELIGIEHHEIGKRMAEEGIADRVERIINLLIWAQERALSHDALDRMSENAADLGLDYDMNGN